MELHLLRKFVVVAEELHFGRAAARLHVAQSPLSQQIRKLEADLGVPLLERTTRRVTLTTAGHMFLTEARAVLAQMDRAREVAVSAAAGRSGYLQLVYVGSAAFHLLPPLLRAYRRVAPEVRLELREHTTAEQVEALSTSQAQVAFLRSIPQRAGLRGEVLTTEPILIALPADHRLAGETEVDLAVLADEPFILFRRDLGPTFHDLLLALCHSAGFAPRVEQVTRHMATTASLVGSGLGVSLVPASVSALRAHDVCYRPIAGGSASVDLVMAWRADQETELVNHFLTVARTVGRRLTIT
nr:LysR family transcriptional regulator [Kibdelosporangium sp. MJ126-NF4]CEL17378.1 LysR family transcriptional regulator YnfL [Kibdelosporangium sp. MJ126-NF4]CTQ91395.1 LysR family transcriptional regulator YnfL [Kibdelosporangium sp. MJ126-NF4]